ncbi:DUF3826 domain-containing protein [Puia sp.]|jgi:hypothetical protein|uniref:DUF3826 domain-containing protein n=1 Tax=Puia sp. TaxID=2045100 RepID=UPI002F4233B6
MKVSLLALGISLLQFAFSPSYAGKTVAQTSNEDTAYLRVITERAGKIVTALNLPDSAAFLRVRTIVAGQYRALNAVYTDRDTRLKELKDQTDKTIVDSVKKIIQQDVDTRVAKLHTAYLEKLATELDQQKIDKVKDGMTYSVVEVTYRAYQQMLPNLTDPQKAYILAALIEAREHAMDAESSEKKHAWFGKYKGRINNYLSAQGISMKK